MGRQFWGWKQFAMFRINFVLDCRRAGKRQFIRLKHVWKTPTGHDTNIVVYNERVKEKVPLIFPNKNYVKWYMCGPTVYDSSHIGHARILKEYYDIHPLVALGITDVSEKIVNKGKLLKQPIWEITSKYTLEFLEHMGALNVLPPAFKLKVTSHMDIILAFIDLLLRRRSAYVGIDGSVYFNVEKDQNYGKFRSPSPDDTSLSIPGKRDPRDFALWKIDKDSGYWDSPWGRGTPGWHIECSAMGSHVFGNSIDIHSGGKDLIFPHHENEEAQSTCYHRCDQWVNYWLHTGLIKVGDVKMSKSLKNYISIRDFLSHYKSDHFRMFCFMSSYRTDLNFDDQTMLLAIQTCEKISSFLDVAESYITGIWSLGNVDEGTLTKELENTKEKVKEALADDFGTPEALKALMLLVKTCSKMLHENTGKTSSRSPAVVALIRQYVKQFLKSFGFTFVDGIEKHESPSAINTVVTAAVRSRSQVRNVVLSLKTRKKDELLVLCDEFRKKLVSVGIEVTDVSPSQSHWSFTSSYVNNKTLLKDVIDCTVWFRKGVMVQITNMSLCEKRQELSDVCKHIKLYFGTLGIDIRDNIDGRLDWTFPNAEKEQSIVLEGVIASTLQFHTHVREVAEAMPDKEWKSDLLNYCDSVISDLDGFGIKVDEKNKIFEIQDGEGMFLLNNLVDIVVHSRNQALVVANTTEDKVLKRALFQANGRTRKTLGTFGFHVHEPSTTLYSSWTMKFGLASSSTFKNVVDIAVALLSTLVHLSETTKCRVEKDILYDICKSTIADLRLVGVTVKNLNKTNPTWYFQPSKGVIV